MQWPLQEKTIRRIFDIGVILKGIHALLEFIGGVTILFVSKSFIMGLAGMLTSNELSEDPHDLVANYIIHTASQYSVHFKYLASLWLISHGLVFGFLVIGLLLKKLWTYPISIVVFGFFVILQAWQSVLTHSWFLMAAAIFDLAVMVLTWHEYRYLKRQRSAGQAS